MFSHNYCGVPIGNHCVLDSQLAMVEVSVSLSTICTHLFTLLLSTGRRLNHDNCGKRLDQKSQEKTLLTLYRNKSRYIYLYKI